MSDLEERLRALLEESGIPQGGSEEMAALLASLDAEYVDDVTPEPGPELAALLRGGGRAPTTRTPFRRRHRAAFTGMAALSVVLGTGWAAAANELPAPAQHWVAEFSQRFLPFDLPFPESSARGRVPDAPQGDRRARGLDEDDARPTPAEGADGESPQPRQQALQKSPRDVVDGDPAPDDGDGGQPSVDESPEGAVQESQRDAAETSEPEETPDRTRESSETQETQETQTQETQETETQQTESGETTDSGAEPAGSTSSDAPEESPDD